MYDVLYEGRLIRDPSYAPALSRSRRSLGVAAAFIVSGLMHEHMYMYASSVPTLPCSRTATELALVLGTVYAREQPFPH